MPEATGTGTHALADGASWRASRRSDPADDGVQVAMLADGAVALRHSGHPDGPVLVYTRDEMTAFLLGTKDGEFDDMVDERP